MAVLLGGGVHLLHGFQVYRQAKALKDASERAEGENDLDEAIRQLRSYLFLKPGDIPAQLRLGQLYVQKVDAAEKAGDVPSLRGSAPPPSTRWKKVCATPNRAPPEELVAEFGREEAERQWHESLRKAQRKAAEMALIIGRPSDAESHLTVLLDETPYDAELICLHGKALFNSLKPDEACEQFRKAIKIDPTHIDSYLLLADVLRSRLHRQVDADQVMLEMITQKDNAKSVKALQAYAEYLRIEMKFDEALIQAKRVLELAPEDPVGLLIAGCCCVAQQHYQTAEDYLKRGIKAAKSNPNMYRTMAMIKTRLRRPNEAIVILQEGLQNTKGYGYAEILWDMVNAYIVDQRFEDAEKHIKELQGLAYRAERVEYLKARLAVVENHWNEATSILVALLPKLHDDTDLDIQKLAYLYLGQCYRQQGEPEKQIHAYLEALKIDSNLSQARMELAEVYLSLNKFQEAAEQYEKVVNGPHPEIEAAIGLARVMIMMRRREEPAKRDWKPVENLLDQIERQQPALGPNLAVLRAEVLLAQGFPDKAEALFKPSAEKFPKNVQVWMALINLAMYQTKQEADPGKKEKGWEQVSDYIDQAEKNLGDHPMLRKARARCAVLRKDPQAGAVLKKLGENLNETMTDFARIEFWGKLAALSVQAGDLDLARDFTRKAADKDKANIRLQCNLCQLDLQAYDKGQTPDLQEFDKRLNEIERMSGRGPFWLYAKAIRTLIQSKKTDPQLLTEARGYLQEAMEARGDWSDPTALAGKICEMQDDREQALEFYERAVRMGDHDGDVISRTAHSSWPAGALDEAKQLFDYLEMQKSPLVAEMDQDYLLVKAHRYPVRAAEKDVDKSVAANSKKLPGFLVAGALVRRPDPSLERHGDQ